jgi:hypothetical protein
MLHGHAARTAAVLWRHQALPEPGVLTSACFALICCQVLRGRGFALLRGLPVERWTRQQTLIAYWGIGLHWWVARNARLVSYEEHKLTVWANIRCLLGVIGALVCSGGLGLRLLWLF